jgi:hypothetical protein
VNEAFENAAASYFPNSMIKPELRESAEPHGMWQRMPLESGQKRYAKYNDTFPVEISPRLASTIKTFGGATLHDHLRDHHGLQDGHPYKGKVTLYQVLPGTRGSTIARAEKFPAAQLHRLRSTLLARCWVRMPVLAGVPLQALILPTHRNCTSTSGFIGLSHPPAAIITFAASTQSCSSIYCVARSGCGSTSTSRFANGSRRISQREVTRPLRLNASNRC